ncbi:MAG TPA: hypothetical protein VKA84_28865 [Gemmatimonadaceae bacterium]|nr:hypothetical protein [Gemmatimonadaceae bacterium]
MTTPTAAHPDSAMTPASNSAAPTAVRKLSPVLLVDAIEPCLPLWTERLGFELTVQVPEGDRLGFVILVKDGVEVMYQSWASVRNDIPALAEGADPRATAHTALFIEVADVEAVARVVQSDPSIEVAVARRKTFYGMDEIGVREPGGHVVIFAQQT